MIIGANLPKKSGLIHSQRTILIYLNKRSRLYIKNINIDMKALHYGAFILVIIGGLNWLLRVFGFDLETWGLPMIVTQVVYALVGLSALYLALTHSKDCKTCSSSAPMA